MERILLRAFAGTRVLLVALAALAPLAPARAGPSAAEPARRPNVVLLLADDLRADAVGALGGAGVRTPHLDALARGGTVLRNCYIMGSNSGAVCMPSRAMLLSGRGLFRLPGNGHAIPREWKTFPQRLREAGYDTFVTGKWHNDRPALARSFSDGGAIFFGGMGGHTGVPVHAFDPSGRYAGKGTPDGSGKYSSELFADEAVRFVRGRKGDARPFYLHLAFTAPHDPREVPPGWEGAYDPAAVKLPANFLGRHPFDNGEMAVRDELLAGTPREAAWVRAELAKYYAMVGHLDAQVGRVIAALRECGQEENTVVVFAADNGLALGSHGLLGKQNLYDHSAKVPLVVKGPGVGAGRGSEALCYLHDLFPTVCELAGAAAPENDGRSLAPLLRGEAEAARDGLLLAYRDVQRAYRDGRYKLIEYRVGETARAQLFDLALDPAETRDLSAEPSHAARLAEMRKTLAAERAAAGDPLARG